MMNKHSDINRLSMEILYQKIKNKRKRKGRKETFISRKKYFDFKRTDHVNFYQINIAKRGLNC